MKLLKKVNEIFFDILNGIIVYLYIVNVSLLYNCLLR